MGQFIENKRNIANGDGFRILCLGDSVMAFGGEYSIPSQLQNILNAKYPGVHFIALNQGAINATLETIYDHLPEYLDRYNPDLVVSMSGNSSENLAPKDKSSTFSSIFKYSKGIRLMQSLGVDLLAKVQSIVKEKFLDKLDFGHKKLDKKQEVSIDVYLDAMVNQSNLNPSSENFTKLGFLYRAAYKDKESLIYFLRAAEISPGNYIASRAIAEHYLKMSDFEKASPFLIAFIRCSPNTEVEAKIWGYTELEKCCLSLNKEVLLKVIYEDAVNSLPDNDWGYERLGRVLFDEGNFAMAKNLFIKELMINPSSNSIKDKIAVCDIKLGDYSSARKILESAASQGHGDKMMCWRFADLLVHSNEIEKAEQIMETMLNIDHDQLETLKTIHFDPYTPESLYEYLIKIYDLMGDSKRSLILKESVKKHKQRQSNAYMKIYNLVHKRNIPFVAVQYPMRSIEDLKHQFNSSKDLFFVDNESCFKEAIDKSNYFVYFIDRSGKDYGHGTLKGNQMIADNIAKVILNIPRIIKK